MYVGPGQQAKVRSQNTQGYKGETVIAERHEVARASARGQAMVSTIQEAGGPPPSWPWTPVPGQPNLQQATVPAGGRRGAVYAVHQTPPPGPSGNIPTRNSQLLLSSRPFMALNEVRSPAVPATQRAALVARTDHGTFGSQHAVSGAPALSAVQTRHHWNQMAALTPPGEHMNLSGDFNHDLATSNAAAGLAAAPAPQVRRPSGATHQGGRSLDGFWTSSPAAGPARATRGMTGDHMGSELTDIT